MEKLIIAGLGNPGPKYRDTRHNIGFKVADKLASQFNVKMSGGFYSEFGDFVFSGKKIFIQKPGTYMNLSGKAVAGLAEYHDVENTNILIIYDDVDLPYGKIKFKMKGSSAGHKGLISIISCLGGEDFPRLKAGIGKPENQNIRISDYVLGKFSSEESKQLDDFLNLCKNAALCFIEEGAKIAMTDFNNKTIDKEE